MTISEIQEQNFNNKLNKFLSEVRSAGRGVVFNDESHTGRSMNCNVNDQEVMMCISKKLTYSELTNLAKEEMVKLFPDFSEHYYVEVDRESIMFYKQGSNRIDKPSKSGKRF
jgi:hypothetical protein